MRPCPHCSPYGGDPGMVPVVLQLSAAELALPPEQRPPAQIIWVPCTNCHGSVASCCDTAGAAGSDVNYTDTRFRPVLPGAPPPAAAM